MKQDEEEFMPYTVGLLPTVEEAGVIAVKIAEELLIGISPQELAFYIAGWENCIQFLRTSNNQKIK